MKRTILCLALILSTLQPIEALAIENGKDATGNTHVVKVIALFSKGKVSSCSGGVLSEYVIVTAAHCLDDESGLLSKEIWVLPPGSSSKRDANGAYVQEQSWITVDNTQITLTYQNSSEKVEDDDLAFLVLSRPIKLDVKTLIPSEDETARLRTSNATLRLYGYGYISDSGISSETPNYYIARFDSQASVSVKNSGYATATDSTSCQGDSGGPVLSVTPTTVTVVGIITGGPTSVRCGKKQSDGKYYTLFTFLSRYANLAFSAASIATKRALENANSENSKTQDSLNQAISRYQLAEKDASDAIDELEIANDELEVANERIGELERIIQDLQNQIKILSAKLTVTINCARGAQVKKVTGIAPKCPTGYIKK